MVSYEQGPAASLTASGGASAREVYGFQQYDILLQRVCEAHVLSGQMVASLEAGDGATFATLAALYTRANHEAGEALVCMDAARTLEGSA